MSTLPKIRQKPKLAYCGLTIVMQWPSRMDVHELLSGYAGHLFKNECLRPDVVVQQCDVRTSNTIDEGLMNGTKAILLLGHKAMVEWGKPGLYDNYTLGEQRGCPLQNKWNLPMIASYFPQDTVDRKDYESTHNVHDIADAELTANESGDEDDDDEGDVKKKGKTKRSNYRFWLIQDTKKILSAITYNKFALATTYEKTASPVIYPELEDICSILKSNRDKNLYLDIECHPETQMLYCIGLAIDNSPVYVVPIFRWNGVHAYVNLGKFLGCLAIAMSRNTVICHNGFTFDLLLLASRYRVLFGRRNLDTMLMTHRCFPEAEKSLGHCVSLWTWEPYHKDEGTYEPHSEKQEQDLWHYNAKDVSTMRSICNAIGIYAKRIPGLSESLLQANTSIYPYALNSLLGICYNEAEVLVVQKEYDRLMTQYLRMCRLLLGRNFLPTSHKDCPQYFHTEMGYKVVARTKKQAPSLGKGAMYKLKLKYPHNPIIDICLRYRQVGKKAGDLKWNKWQLPYQNILQQTLSGTTQT